MKSQPPSSAEQAAPPDPLALLGPGNVEPWQQLGRAIRNALPVLTFQRALPTSVGEWPPDVQRTWLRAATTLAARAPRAAVTVYRSVPPALCSIPPGLRGPVLRILEIIASDGDPAEIESICPLLGAVVLDVPATARHDAIDLVMRVACDCPIAVPGFLRVLARIIEAAPGDRAREWVLHGLDLAEANREVGRAYFALESQTSVRMLHSSTTAVALAEVESVLHRYVQMLSGIPALASAAGRFRLVPPLEARPGAGSMVLPGTIDVLATWEDNARLYRVVASFVAARREFGTYDDAVITRVRESDHGPLLEDCFLLADGYRLAHRLTMVYRGIGTDIRWAAEQLLTRWSAIDLPRALVFDAMLARAIAPHHAQVARWIADAAAVVVPCLTPLAEPGATAQDAAAVAEVLTSLLAFARRQQPIEPDIIAAEQFLLDTGDDASAAGRADDADGQGLAAETPPPGSIPPELLADLELQLGELAEQAAAAGRPLTAEELARLIEAGLIPQLGRAEDPAGGQAGLYITQLIGKLLGDKLPRQPTGARTGRAGARPGSESGSIFFYEEWDHVIDDYRPGWCRLHELALGEDAGLFFTSTLDRYAPLVPEIRRHFQRIRPERWRTLRGLEDGEDFDLNAAIDARAERRARGSPSTKLYTARARLEREVATLFLLDMSASTDETAEVAGARRRIIDIQKEALVIMSAALEELGDAYAIYGFSGQGRNNVEFYPIKAFNERLAPGAKGRIGGIEPRCSTRMGTALRHALRKMREVRAPNRHLILISDGFPQDLDYGDDRRSYAYGISDTAVALREIEAADIKPFCITVDLAGHDYLREMCDPQRYMIIENVADLPHELPKIYQRLVHSI
jgi:nitric oxide reductase NorD protein